MQLTSLNSVEHIRCVVSHAQRSSTWTMVAFSLLSWTLLTRGWLTLDSLWSSRMEKWKLASFYTHILHWKRTVHSKHWYIHLDNILICCADRCDFVDPPVTKTITKLCSKLTFATLWNSFPGDVLNPCLHGAAAWTTAVYVWPMVEGPCICQRLVASSWSSSRFPGQTVCSRSHLHQPYALWPPQVKSKRCEV